tara:strand:+ start:783 stop:992 length:210 start_codon:yes stop_codon:yes gene_type:complete
MADKEKKQAYQRWKLYEVQGDKLIRKNPYSPKDNGLFMAVHKDRKHCGVTGHTETDNQKQETAEEKQDT